jgi:hypothetical protein
MTTDPETEIELRCEDYVATHEELQIIDAAMASIDAGESASAAEIKAVFAKFRRT